jgi:NAD(P)-dependent dehydrogenase (short-subunit alcohol dehydrogenase family)
VIAQEPIGRMGRPEEMRQPWSGCALTASFVTGHAMVVDGGPNRVLSKLF